MTEAQWLASHDHAPMLAACLAQDTPGGKGNLPYRPSQRQLRLWSAALYDLSEYDYGEGADLLAWRRGEAMAGDDEMDTRDFSLWVNPSADFDGDPPFPIRAAVLRDIVGNPFRPVSLCGNPDHGSVPVRPFCPACQRWREPIILSLARAAYEDRQHDGTLARDRLLVLADALEEAGFTGEVLLRHLRGEERLPLEKQGDGQGGYELDNRWVVIDPDEVPPLSAPAPPRWRFWGWQPLRGPHVRGCWVVDLLLGLS